MQVSSLTPIETIKNAYHADTHRFELAAGALDAPNIYSLIHKYLGTELLLTDSSPPEENGKLLVVVSGSLLFGRPFSDEKLAYKTTVTFDLNDPDQTKVYLQLSIDPANWSLTGFFPELLETDLRDLLLSPDETNFWLSSDQTTAHEPELSQGVSMGGAISVQQSFPAVATLIPETEPVRFQGAIDFTAEGGYSFSLSIAKDFPAPFSDYPLTFLLAICADIPASLSGDLPPQAQAFGSLQIGVVLPLGESRVRIDGYYQSLGNTLNLALSTEDSSLIGLNDLGQLIPKFISDGLTSLIPIQQLQAIESVSRIFNLRKATIQFDLGELAVRGINSELHISPGASDLGELKLDLLIGDIVLDGIDIAFNIQYPFQEIRQLSAVVTARMGVFDIPLEASAATGGLLTVRLPADRTLAIRPLIQRFTGLPENTIPALTFTTLSFSIDLHSYALSLNAGVDEWKMNLGNDVITFHPATTMFQLQGRSESSGSAPAYFGEITGGVSLLGFDTNFSLTIAEHFTASFMLEHVKIRDVLEKLSGAPVPFLPDDTLDKLEITATPALGQLRFELTLNNINFPADDPIMRISSAHLIFDQKSAGDYTIDLTLNGSAALDGAVTLDEFSLHLFFGSQHRWVADGHVNANVLGTSLQLAAGYSYDAEAELESLVLEYDTNHALLEFEGVHFACNHFYFRMERKGDRTTISADAPVELKIGPFPTLAGTLTVFASGEKQGVRVEITEGGEFDVPVVQVAELAVGAHFALTELQLEHVSDSGWGFGGTSVIRLDGLPDYVYEHGIVPLEGTEVTLTASPSKLCVEADKVTAIDRFDIPDLEIGGEPVVLSAFGPASIALNDLRLELGKDLLLTARLQIGLPKQLNDVFGITEQGDAVVNLFRTLPETMDLRFGLGLRNGSPAVYFSFETLPFLPTLVTTDGEKWLIDLGDCGQLRAEPPVFSYTGTNFEFAGGVEGLRSLKIPLQPLKTLLERTGAKVAGELLPSEPLPFADFPGFDGQGNFNADRLIILLDKILPGAVVPPIKQALETLARYGNRLPPRFRKYLQFRMIDSISWQIAVTADAGVNIDISVGDESQPRDERIPLQVLYPGMIPPGMPTLQGVRLYGLSFGVLLGGNLFSLRLDADFDQFDLASLAASVVIPEDSSLPIARDFHRTIVIDRLWMPIIYQTGFPIPIPLFYNELAVDVLGIEGVGLQSHVYFPQPVINVVTWIKLFLKFKDFILDRDAKFSIADVPEEEAIRFWLSNCYLKLPEYLGGQIVGVDKDRFFEFNTLDAAQVVVDLMNTIKFFKFRDIIQFLPEEVRQGNEFVALGPLTSDAQWLISTGEDVSGETKNAFGWDSEQTQALVQLAPGTGAEEKGLVVILSGDCKLEKLAGLSLRFALVAQSTQQFETGLTVKGIIGALTFSSCGHIAVGQPDGPAVLIELTSTVDFGELSLMSGTSRVAYDNQNVTVAGDFHLLPIDFPFNIKSNGPISGSIGSQGLRVEGSVESTLRSLQFSDVTAYVSDEKVYFSGMFLGNGLSLDVSTAPGRANAVGDVKLAPFSLRTDLNINLKDKTGTFGLTGSIVNQLVLTQSASLPAPKGTIFLAMVGIELFKGSASAGGDGFALSGNLNVIPPGSIVSMSIGVSGNLNSSGIYLSGRGSAELNIGLKFILAITVSLRNGFPSSSATVTLPWPVGEIGVKSGIFPYRNKVALCLQWTLLGVTTYIAIGPGFLVYQYKRPGDWPLRAVLAVEQFPQSVRKHIMQRQIDSEYTITDILRTYCTTDWFNGGGDDNYYTDTLDLSSAYRLRLEYSAGNAEDFKSATETESQVLLHSSHWEDDYIDDLKVKISTCIEDDDSASEKEKEAANAFLSDVESIRVSTVWMEQEAEVPSLSLVDVNGSETSGVEFDIDNTEVASTTLARELLDSVSSSDEKSNKRRKAKIP